MKKLAREHQLIIALTLFLLVVFALGTWATWYEFVHNEQAGPNAHFFGPTFLAYWSMQFLMNFAPEIAGFIVITAFAAEFRERWQKDK